MIEEAVKIHDNYQFEIKLNYKFENGDKDSAYGIDTYLFIPGSLGINRHTYKKRDFYGDIQTYIRLKTPTISLKNLVSGAESYFTKLTSSLENVAAGQSRAENDFEYYIKMLCCILKSSLRDHINEIGRCRDDIKRQNLIADYVSSIREIISKFRRLADEYDIRSMSRDIISNYNFGDEYISILIETFTYRLLETIRENRGGDVPDRVELFKLIRNEIEYRKLMKYRSVFCADSGNEEPVFRMSVFKKYMGSVLYLNTHIQREGRIIDQAISGLAAGLAMIFATAIAFLAMGRYGNITLPLFIALVVSYIFKDRIKEAARIYFSRKMRRFLFDYKIDIYSDRRTKIGCSEESFNFIGEKRLPEKIRQLRNKDHITEIENEWLGEKVILFRKYIKISPEKLRSEHKDILREGIVDITRFNIFHYLRRMDNPRKELFILQNDDYRKADGERVYHLNMIIRYLMPRESIYKRFRIILNREGIRRIEEVTSLPAKPAQSVT